MLIIYISPAENAAATRNDAHSTNLNQSSYQPIIHRNKMNSITESTEWQSLEKHHRLISNIHMRKMFDDDPQRFEKFSIEFNGLLLDYSKNIINEETICKLTGLARKAGVKERTEQMFTGKKINLTEKRAVLHTALRNDPRNPIYVDGSDVMPEIMQVKEKITRFVDSLHDGRLRSSDGEQFTDIVNIGIGGSHLGPDMVCTALKHFSIPPIKTHFVSNIDGDDITDTLMKLNPKTTLFIIASKTFTTKETLTNANTARRWLLERTQAGRNAIAKQFVAISTNFAACEAFGIDKENIFEFGEWVGGRYSLWSAIGLSIAISIGMKNFNDLLRGAHDMDNHFRHEPLEKNIPAIMAMIGIWYTNFFGARTSCVIPYSYRLSKFPDFLQQLDMESNGKAIRLNGSTADYPTGTALFGAAGTNAQHSFFQLIHQGTSVIPADFIAVINSPNNLDGHQNILLANFFAQTEALMKGKKPIEVRNELILNQAGEEIIKDLLPHKTFAGNRPTNSLILNRLSPYTLGLLIALYEHKVFTQGIIWNINSFDQWGVELGKQLAGNILPELSNGTIIKSHDSSTNGLINYFKRNGSNFVD